MALELRERVLVGGLLLDGADGHFPCCESVGRFDQSEAEGRIGALADEHYSCMGYQERSLLDWRNTQGPELAARLKERKVDVLLLAPA